VDQEDQGDHNPPWWTRTGFYILLMLVRMDSVEPERKTDNMVDVFREEVERLKAAKKIELREEEETKLGCLGDEDVIMGGVIVAGGNFRKAKKKKNKKKRKSKTPAKEVEEVEKEEEEQIENEDMDGIIRNWTKAEGENYVELKDTTIEVVSDYHMW